VIHLNLVVGLLSYMSMSLCYPVLVYTVYQVFDRPFCVKENSVTNTHSVCNKLYSAKLFSEFCTFLICNGEMFNGLNLLPNKMVC
jgi:hypothetical protein